MPLVGVFGSENGYLEISGYTRANRAVFTPLEADKTVIEIPNQVHAFTYEIDNFTNMVLSKDENPTLEKTQHF